MFTIFFDIASAFDKVWHNGLVYKLIDSKFPNHLISWIKEFLKNRMFCVRVGSVITCKLNILAELPQGAVLSPTLFSILSMIYRSNSAKINFIHSYLRMICVLSKYLKSLVTLKSKFKLI
jgi:hypothetical protein